ncbi:MAG: hypothetical protein ACXWL2_02605 [Candidatus Chromulinivorax sp.]
MNTRKRYIALATLMLLPITELLSMESSANISQQTNDVVANALETMQNCINFNQLVTKNNPQLQQVRQQSLFKEAINYIENIRSESKRNLERPDLAQLNQVAFAQNRSEELFSRLLDEILVHYTTLSETKGLLYRRVYKLSSVDGDDQPILGAHENKFREVLQNGAKQAGWGKSVIVNLPAVQQDGSAVVRSLNLHEIINALPAVGMSTAAKVGLAVGGAAAIGAAAYGTYNYLQQPGVSPITAGVESLQKDVNEVEDKLNQAPQISDATPQQIDVSSYENAAEEFSEHLQKLKEVAAANPSNQAAQEELAQAQGTLEKLQNGDFAALTAEDYGKIGLGAASVALGAKGMQAGIKAGRNGLKLPAAEPQFVAARTPRELALLENSQKEAVGVLPSGKTQNLMSESSQNIQQSNALNVPFTENTVQWRNMPEGRIAATSSSTQNRVNQHLANREKALGTNTNESVYSKMSSPFTEKSGYYPVNKGVLVGEGSVNNLSKEAVFTERGALDNLRVNEQNIAAGYDTKLLSTGAQPKLLPSGSSKNMSMAERAELNAADSAVILKKNQLEDLTATNRRTQEALAKYNNKDWQLARKEASSLPNTNFNAIQPNPQPIRNRSWDEAIRQSNIAA